MPGNPAGSGAGDRPFECFVLGTDTGVGKTAVTALLARGLRAHGRRVWIHKPVACGGWDGSSADDARALAPLVGDGQDPATCCPRQWPEAASPHLAAAAAGDAVSLDELADALAALRGDHDLLVEGAGGLLSPLTVERATACDLARRIRLPVVLVTRPHLGTLNHTALSAAHARRSGLHVLGLVIDHHEPVEPSLAVRTAAGELAAVTGLPVLAEVPYAAGPEAGRELAASLLARCEAVLP